MIGNNKKLLVVGISDLKIARVPEILITYALGSCIGICLFDSIKGIAGLSHIMLPLSTDYMTTTNIYKFADTAIPELIKQMERYGASKIRMTAKIAGGAQMFKTENNSSISNIGKRNIDCVKDVLQKQNIKIIAQDIGLNYGRTIEFNPEDGKMLVKSAHKGTLIL